MSGLPKGLHRHLCKLTGQPNGQARVYDPSQDPGYDPNSGPSEWMGAT